jgi:hypothetical protein
VAALSESAFIQTALSLSSTDLLNAAISINPFLALDNDILSYKVVCVYVHRYYSPPFQSYT